MGSADTVTLKSKQQRDGKRKKDRSEVAKLLKQDGRADLQDRFDLGAGVNAQLRNEWEDGDSYQASRRLNLLVVKDLQNVRAGQ